MKGPIKRRKASNEPIEEIDRESIARRRERRETDEDRKRTEEQNREKQEQKIRGEEEQARKEEWEKQQGATRTSERNEERGRKEERRREKTKGRKHVGTKARETPSSGVRERKGPRNMGRTRTTHLYLLYHGNIDQKRRNDKVGLWNIFRKREGRLKAECGKRGAPSIQKMTTVWQKDREVIKRDRRRRKKKGKELPGDRIQNKPERREVETTGLGLAGRRRI